MRSKRFSVGGVALVAGLFCAANAAGQSATPAAFVANNGNLEGAVTSFTFDGDGRPQFVQKLVIGLRPAGSDPIPGTNAYAIDITPNGRFLAVSHATALDSEQLTIVEVHADATMTVVNTPLTPGSPLDLAWVRDDLLAVTRTQLGGMNEVIVYAFDAETAALSEVDRGAGGSFTSSVAAHPSGQFLYAADSNAFFIRVFEVAPGGTLTEIQTEPTNPTYPLGIAISPDGTRLYAGGGISNGRNKLLGYHVGPDGGLTAMAGMPFLTSGNSPFNINYSSDGGILFVGHGTDATVRSFLIDGETGGLTETGFMFDVGLQGSFGDSATLGDWLLVTDDFSATDNTTGLYTFAIESTGEFIQTGPISDTGATAPTEIAVWSPAAPCPGDVDGDGTVGLSDLSILLSNFGCDECPPPPNGDLNNDGIVALDDLAMLLTNFGASCP